MQCVGTACTQPLHPSGVDTLFKNRGAKSPKPAEWERLTGLRERTGTRRGVIPASSVHNLHAYLD